MASQQLVLTQPSLLRLLMWDSPASPESPQRSAAQAASL